MHADAESTDWLMARFVCDIIIWIGVFNALTLMPATGFLQRIPATGGVKYPQAAKVTLLQNDERYRHAVKKV